VLPLIEHVFGIQPDATDKTVVFDPHLPTGWEDMSIEDLPVGTNLISFSRARTARDVEYDIEAKEDGWRFVLKGKALPDEEHSKCDICPKHKPFRTVRCAIESRDTSTYPLELPTYRYSEKHSCKLNNMTPNVTASGARNDPEPKTRC
jgi:hypothetical protein